MALGEARVRMADEADAAQLLELINTIQPHAAWTMEHLLWQYFRLPSGTARIYLICDQDLIVASYAVLPLRFTIRGQPEPQARTIQDVMTRPAYRGQGFLHHLGRCCLDDMVADQAIGYIFPNKLSEGSFRRIGWQLLCPVPMRRAAVAAAPRRRTAPAEQHNARFDKRADQIWAASGLRLGASRDHRSLGWRYRKPGTTYHCYWIDHDAGLLVLKPSPQDGRPQRLHLCELLLAAEERPRLPEVLALCSEVAAGLGASELTAYLPAGHPYETAFEDHGLLLDRQWDRNLYLLAPPQLLGQLSRPGDWHLSHGDHDIF